MQGILPDSMHGSIFIFLKRFVENRHNYSTWVTMLESAGLHSRLEEPYQMDKVYPVSELFSIMAEGALVEAVTYPEFQMRLGKFLVPDLVLVFRRFIYPTWRTFDMLQHIGSHMHGGIKQENQETNPPPLHVTKVGKNVLVIDYHSKRRMAGFAMGIIKGLALYFQEADRVRVTPVTDLLAERVQIKVEFS